MILLNLFIPILHRANLLTCEDDDSGLGQIHLIDGIEGGGNIDTIKDPSQAQQLHILTLSKQNSFTIHRNCRRREDCSYKATEDCDGPEVDLQSRKVTGHTTQALAYSPPYAP